MGSALQDYLNRLQNYEGLQSELVNEAQLKQDKTQQILGALEQLGLPAGFEGLQSLKEYAVNQGKNLVSGNLPGTTALKGDGGLLDGVLEKAKGVVNNLVLRDPQGNIIPNDLLTNITSRLQNATQTLPEPGGDFLSNITGKLRSVLPTEGNDVLSNAGGRLQEVATQLTQGKLQEAQKIGGRLLGSENPEMESVLQRQLLSKLPLKQATQKLAELKARTQGVVRDGEIVSPEARQGSLTALTREDLNARLPSGGDFQSEINNLSGAARDQYIRVMQGDPTEMGSLLPEHLFDHAQFVGSQAKEAGILNPESLVPEAKQAMNEAFSALPRVLPRQMPKILPDGQLTRQPATTSENIGNLFKQLKTQQSQKETEMQNMAEIEPARPAPTIEEVPVSNTPAKEPEAQDPATRQPAQEVQEGTQPSEITPAQEGKQAVETGLNAGDVSEELTNTVKSGLGGLGETLGEGVGEAVGESFLGDLAGPIGGLIGLGTLISSLVESFKHQQVPQAPTPVLQAGTD
jgi:hypothetical protein